LHEQARQRNQHRPLRWRQPERSALNGSSNGTGHGAGHGNGTNGFTMPPGGEEYANLHEIANPVTSIMR
jgi:hypothetical protein